MYLIGSPARDYDEVMNRVNAKLDKDLNASLTVNWIGWGDFGAKYPQALASGEPVDLIYVSSWGNYYGEAAKGAFLPLEELLPIYAPKTFEEITPDFMRQATTGGHLYGAPSAFSQIGMMGYIVRGDLMKKYGMDGISGIDDYGAFLERVMNEDPDIAPGDFMSGWDALDRYYAGSLNLLLIDLPFYIDLGAAKPAVINFYDLPGVAAHFLKMKDWHDKGYWPQTVLSEKEENRFRDGKAASRLHNQDSWTSVWLAHPEYEAQFYFAMPFAFRTAAMQDGMAVPVAAKHPERALTLLELLRQDESYYDLMTYGIEGKHWELNGKGELVALDTDGFTPEAYCSWGFKEPKFFKVPAGMPPNLAEVNAALEAMSSENPYALFFPDYEPIKSERAAVFNVWQQYGLPLAFGLVEVESGLATVREKLAEAGVEAMRDELQRQLEAFISRGGQ
jgi:putative aldouronate transport system substrate-binding protein